MHHRNCLLSSLCLVFVLFFSMYGFASSCGGDHQRACCFLEASFGACQGGLTEVAGCPAQDSLFQGDCTCPGGVVQASTSCEANISHCGDEGERACCVGENGGAACNNSLHQQTLDGCTGDNCYCSSGAKSSGTCFSPTSCGGAGQRACCDGNGEFSNNGLACDSGFVQVPGCDPSTGSCYCPSGLFKSGGTCVRPSACGGKGQRACCSGTLEYAPSGDTSTSICNSGLIAINGCAGDCTCGGTTSVGESSTQTCTVIETINEPTINGVPALGLPSGPECPNPPALCGYSDLHVHMFAHLAHGGATVAGTPYDPSGGVNTALGEDYGSNNRIANHSGTLLNKVDGTDGLPACPDYMINSPIGNLCNNQYLFHGDHTPFDTTTYGGTNDASASNFGAPSFNGWPQWTSTIHQQVYYKWLERAWMGGLRLMVMSAVTNETLCKTSVHLEKYDGTYNTDCTNSMVEIDKQLNAAKDFEAWLDTQYGGAGQGWFRIVTNPQQAADVIQHGKLAVVLGIEVENLFNCHFKADVGTPNENAVYPFEPTTDPPTALGTCTPQFVQDQVQHYYDMGVRHIFPIHNFDNAYGGPAAWQDSINVGNAIGEGEFWSTENCHSDNYGFWLDAGNENFEVGVLTLLGYSIPAVPSYTASTSSSPFATCNTLGLTSLGQTLINALMDKGIVIDIDHMSRHSLDTTLNIAVNRSYPAIAATHVQFFDLYNQNYSDNFGRHERMRTKTQLQQIKDLGGLISVMLKDDVQDTAKGYCLPNAVCFGGAGSSGGKYTVEYNGPSNNYGLTNNCRYSTTEWAQAYMYGADTMGGPVTMGSDFNGIAGHVGPRFGSAACGGDPTERSAQEKANKRLQYPFTLTGFGTFDMQVSGQRTFDFNTSGLAHIGLLPDLVADLKNVGLTDQQLIPLFSSAQAYIDMWAKVSPPIASTLVVSAPATAITGMPFQVVVTAQDTYGNKATGYAGTVQITSGDGTATLPANAMLVNGSGTFIVTLNAGGNQTVSAHDILNSSIMGTSDPISVQQPPTITSASSTTFTTGIAGSFPVTATGIPTTITFTKTGTLPSLVTLDSTGLLSGTPAPGTGGPYPITITASNGVAPNAMQSFTLTVNQPPAITSGNSATFKVGTLGTFPASATGYPAPTFSQTGAPSGVTMSTAGVLSGTPAVGTGGVYTVTITATNGVSPDAHQTFTLTVNEAPSISSANNTTFTTGTAGMFTITHLGYPSPTFSKTGTLPTGVILSSTGVLSGTPAAGTGGIYNITITAANGVLPNATQPFTLTVNQPPAISSANNTTFTTGTAGSFHVTATGFPTTMMFSKTGTLPTGVTLSTGGLLSGTPAAGTGGVYPITITASNGIAPSAMQAFNLVVNQPPTITSGNSATFKVAVPGTFTVTTLGFPIPQISETGALPQGVSFVDNGNRTASLGGRPLVAGTFHLVIKSHNGVASDATQNFTLLVNKGDSTAGVGGPLSGFFSSGQVVTLTALISGGGVTPTGTVKFSTSTTKGYVLGTVTLGAGGTATLKTKLPNGTNYIHVDYSGDANYSPSTSPTLTLRMY